MQDGNADAELARRAAIKVAHDRLDVFAVSILTLLCIFLGIGQVAMKVANAGISPILQGGLRSLLAAALVGLLCAVRGISLRVSRVAILPMIISALFFTAEFAFLYPGLDRTTASRAVIFLYTSPFVVAAGAHFLIPGDRLTWSKAAGLLAALAGIMVVLAGRETTGISSLTGDLLCLAGGISWGLLTLSIRATRLAAERPERVIFMQLLISGLLLPIISLALGERGITDPSPLVLGAFGYTVVFVAFITFTTSLWLMTRYPASRVMAFLMITPAFGVAAGVLLLGEPLTIYLGVGLVVVVLGLWLVNRPATKTK
ncbi:DMT family transporter [Hyphomicrobium sp. CS1BSMeth3]|uniref:DMT family transporter n=1 Tax=Hyphomicrobium sp. CS1BSMeth3 TaxID=1892844 RepID=UPI0009F91C53|nr:DMT family transporter [Hyphomicrobium sp. CS1BSMeth3]